MADEEETPENEDEEGGEGEKKKSPMKLILFAGVPVVLILVGLGAAFMLGLFGGGDDEAHGEEHAEHGEAHGDGHGDAHGDGHGAPKAVDAHSVMFYDLPEVLVDLSAEGKGGSFLKLQVALEVPAETDTHALDPIMPRIIDKFQVFLRELRLEDLSGSAGTYRLKQELLRRVRLSGADVEVYDVLIREMIIQ